MLFSTRGHPALTPWRLVLVTVMQFAEGLSDWQAAEAVRARIDWKYALSMELTDPGFDHSVLFEFRFRLVDGGAEQVLVEKMLVRFRERGWLKVRGRQRTDSTHMLASLRMVSRLELTAETMRAALNTLAAIAPGCESTLIPNGLRGTQGASRSTGFPRGRKPEGSTWRRWVPMACGFWQSSMLHRTPQCQKRLAEVEVLRKICEQQYVEIDGELLVRNPKEMPEAAHCIESPYELEARYATKRRMSWGGYKVHLTESCDEDLPNLITDVRTAVATATDVKQVPAIQEGLAESGLLPL